MLFLRTTMFIGTWSRMAVMLLQRAAGDLCFISRESRWRWMAAILAELIVLRDVYTTQKSCPQWTDMSGNAYHGGLFLGDFDVVTIII